MGDDQVGPREVTDDANAKRMRNLRRFLASSDGQVGLDEDELSGDGDGEDHGVNEQRDAIDRSEADAPSSDQHQEAAVTANPEVVEPPTTHDVPRPRARGKQHPSVPTRAQVERHCLEQHVNYAAWCRHCVQASALSRQHFRVTGTSPDVPTISADFSFMNSNDAAAGDGIPVLVMRCSQTRSLFSHACEGKSTTREGYSAYIIEKSVEDIDSIQKDAHLKTDQEPAMVAF